MIRPAGKLPNLFILGAQKAGTTWLFDHLQSHSEVFSSTPKELFFWNKPPRFVANRLDEYKARFDPSESALYRLEASANYLWVRRQDSQYDLSSFQRDNCWATIDNMKAHGDPEARFIVMLRQPTARAVSAFFHHWRRGRIPGEGRMLMQGRRWGVLDMGFYDQQIPRWLDAFGRERFHFILFDDVRRDPEGVLRDARAFLGLADEPVHAPARPRNQGDRLVVEEDRVTIASQQDDAASPAASPVVWREETTFLNRAYADTIAYCEALLGRDLAAWRPGRFEDLLRL